MARCPVAFVLVTLAACGSAAAPRPAPAAISPAALPAAADTGTSELTHPLLLAAKAGDLSQVEQQLAAGADPATHDGDRSAIVIAAAGGHLSIVDRLFASVPQQQRELALIAAAAAGQRVVVDHLLDRKVSINAADQYGLTPLILSGYAGRTEIVKLLLDRGANPDLRNEDNEAVLHACAAHANADAIVPLLLAKRAQVALVDKRGRIPLNVHAQEGRVAAVKALLDAGSNIDHADTDQQTPLMSASFNGHALVVAELLRRGAAKDYVNRFGATPLLGAAAEGQFEVVKLLAKAGADLRRVTHEGRTALHLAVGSGHARVVELLLDLGIPVDARPNGSYSPLVVAAVAGSDNACAFS